MVVMAKVFQANSPTSTMNDNKLRPLPKTSAERVRAFRARQKTARPINLDEIMNASQPRSQPKTSTERVREYRERQQKMNIKYVKKHMDSVDDALTTKNEINKDNDSSGDEDNHIIKWCMNMTKDTRNLCCFVKSD